MLPSQHIDDEKVCVLVIGEVDEMLSRLFGWYILGLLIVGQNTPFVCRGMNN